MVGVGVLLAAPPPGAQMSKIANPDIQLASFGSVLAPPPPLTPPEGDVLWWWIDGGSDSKSASTASSVGVGGGAGFFATVFNSCGLVCNGVDGIEGDPPDGQRGGLLWGDGGDGWDSTVAGVDGGSRKLH